MGKSRHLHYGLRVQYSRLVSQGKREAKIKTNVVLQVSISKKTSTVVALSMDHPVILYQNPKHYNL